MKLNNKQKKLKTPPNGIESQLNWKRRNKRETKATDNLINECKWVEM